MTNIFVETGHKLPLCSATCQDVEMLASSMKRVSKISDAHNSCALECFLDVSFRIHRGEKSHKTLS